MVPLLLLLGFGVLGVKFFGFGVQSSLFLAFGLEGCSDTRSFRGQKEELELGEPLGI